MSNNGGVGRKPREAKAASEIVEFEREIGMPEMKKR